MRPTNLGWVPLFELFWLSFLFCAQLFLLLWCLQPSAKLWTPARRVFKKLSTVIPIFDQLFNLLLLLCLHKLCAHYCAALRPCLTRKVFFVFFKSHLILWSWCQSLVLYKKYSLKLLFGNLATQTFKVSCYHRAYWLSDAPLQFKLSIEKANGSICRIHLLFNNLTKLKVIGSKLSIFPQQQTSKSMAL